MFFIEMFVEAFYFFFFIYFLYKFSNQNCLTHFQIATRTKKFNTLAHEKKIHDKFTDLSLIERFSNLLTS